MNEGAANYFAALSAIRLRLLLEAERWADEQDEFDLVLAAALSIGRDTVTEALVHVWSAA